MISINDDSINYDNAPKVLLNQELKSDPKKLADYINHSDNLITICESIESIFSSTESIDLFLEYIDSKRISRIISQAYSIRKDKEFVKSFFDFIIVGLRSNKIKLNVKDKKSVINTNYELCSYNNLFIDDEKISIIKCLLRKKCDYNTYKFTGVPKCNGFTHNALVYNRTKYSEKLYTIFKKNKDRFVEISNIILDFEEDNVTDPIFSNFLKTISVIGQEEIERFSLSFKYQIIYAILIALIKSGEYSEQDIAKMTKPSPEEQESDVIERSLKNKTVIKFINENSTIKLTEVAK